MALMGWKKSSKQQKTDNPTNGSDSVASETTDETPPRRFNPIVIGSAAALVLAIVGAVFMARAYVADELVRETQSWQVRLGIVADSRAVAIDGWVEENFSKLRELTENASLQLYLSDLTTVDDQETSDLANDLGGTIDGVTTDRDENPDQDTSLTLENDDDDRESSGIYLRNLMIATAERTGFKGPPPVGDVAANVERVGIAGLGLVDIDGKAIVSTPDMPPLTGKIRAAVAKALDGEPAVIDMFISAGGQPTMGFVLPVFAVQDDSGGSKGIGAIVGVRIVDRDLFDRLKQPGELLKSAETYLIRADGAKINYVSPLADGSAPMKRSLSGDSPDLLDAYMVKRPGGFSNKLDYKGRKSLAVSRAISSVPWILVRKVSRDEALATTETRLNTIFGVFIAFIVIITLTILFVWKRGASARATEALHGAQLNLERFENMSKFMRVVTNSQPNQIIAVDGDTQYTFANQPAADHAGIEVNDMLGKTMASVLGPVKAQAYAEANKQVLQTFERSSQTHFFGDEDILDPNQDNAFQVIKSDHIPLKGDRDFPPGVLMVLSDLTELTTEKRKGEKMMRQLIDTLVSVVDRRDPFSANHSSRVAEVARCIAREMHLDDIQIRTVDIAGNLMNLGKIFIPPEVLTKTDDLTPEERAMVANAYMTTVDLIDGVEFEGPVVETIRQLGETWDGQGPLGLKEEEILMTARILSVANTLVGMVSPRAYRGAMEFRKAADILMEQTDTRLDRKPVTALTNFLENRGGMRRWSYFREAPKS